MPDRWRVWARVSLASGVERHSRDEIERPFNLTSGPLFRALLLRLADNRHALLATMHHSIFDGWSYGVLGRELAHLYRGPLDPPAGLGRAADALRSG